MLVLGRTVLTGAMLAMGAAHASLAAQGTLYDPHFMDDGVVLVYTTGNRPNVPACAASQPARFAIDASTPQRKAQLAGLLAAFAMKQRVVIVGTGGCSLGGAPKRSSISTSTSEIVAAGSG